ncbi:MAG TPA: DNA-directed DNA polymerase [Methanotrichaceae archaeon]|nr:DNA-directed DNA polymerase [Methanotrichaceae archaeon]
MIFQILDANYAYDDQRQPLVQLFGIAEDGRSMSCRVSGFRPYFYAGVEDGCLDEASDAIRDLGLDVEAVDRYEPIGYQPEPTKMLRITTRDPKEVRTLREKVAGMPGISAVYETDILFKNRFLIDQGLGGMGWVEVPDSCRGRDVDFRELQPLQRDANAPLRQMSFDIECLPRNGEMPKPESSPVILISMAFEPAYRGLRDLVLVGKKVDCTREDVWACDGEHDLIQKFVSVVREFDPDIVAGYNSNDFDFTYLSERATRLGLDARVGRDGSSWYIRKVVNLTNVSITGRVVVDLLPLIRSSFSLKQYTLRNAALVLLKMEKYDVDPKEIEALWSGDGEGLRRFISYSRRDAVLALRLLMDLKLMDKYIAMSHASGSLLQDIVNGGQSGMVESLLLRRFREHERVVPPKPDADTSEERFVESDELKGGAVLMPEKGLVEDVVILDYKSLYPTIMMAHNLCYSTVVSEPLPGLETIRAPSGGQFVSPKVSPGIVPAVLRELLDQRTETKRLMKQASDDERRFLDAKQYAMKILLNSFYGYSGYARARLYSLPVANAVTSFGRANILNTKEMIDKIGAVYIVGDRAVFEADLLDLGADAEARRFDLSVVYGDTDSVFVRMIGSGQPSTRDAELIGRKIAEAVTSHLPEPMELVFEAFARRAIFLTKKRYALWVFEPVGQEWRDRIKVRGMETVRRDWCGLTSRTLNRCLELILKEGKVDEAVEYVRSVIDRVSSLNLKEDPELLGDLTLTRRYTKSTASYKNKQPHIQLVEKMRRRGGQLPGIGDRVPFVIVRGSSNSSNGEFIDTHSKGKELFVDKAEDPQYAADNNLAIDTEYYIEKQILPPVLRILTEFNISKEQLCSDSKQSSLQSLKDAAKPQKQKSLFDF